MSRLPLPARRFIGGSPLPALATGKAGAFVRNVFCATTVVPSSNSTLLDNDGLEPALDLPPGICQ